MSGAADHCDVIIVGGGVVGSTLALSLARHARIAPGRIVVVEPRPVAPPAAGTPIGLRVSAISPANRARLTGLGVWAQLDATRIAAIERMAIWHHAVPPDSPDVLRFDAAEHGLAELAAIVENAALQGALLAACAAAGIRVLEDRVQALAIDADGANVRLATTALAAELVIGADGAVSAVRELLRLPHAARSYGQRAIVATIDAERAHGGTAYQCFLDSGPLALLPLPHGQCSIVWSTAEARAAELMAMTPDRFGAELSAASAAVLGQLRLVSERAAFPLQRLAVDRYVAPRVALAGDAAHVIHPLAGQGVNQGLEDAASLTGHLARRPARESPGALNALLAYQRERRAGNALVGGIVHGLDRLFTGSGPFTSLVARSGLALVARSPVARRFFVTRAAAGRSSPRR